MKERFIAVEINFKVGTKREASKTKKSKNECRAAEKEVT
jgi:hypothetical protein